MSKIGASYRRVSTRKQEEEGYSLQTQLLEINTYAAKNGIQLIDDQVDDETGYNLDRPGLTKIRQLVKEKAISVLIVFDSDRLSRNPADYMILREELARYNVELHYVKRGAIDLQDFSQQLIEDIFGRFADKERRMIKERTRRGKIGKLLDGKVITTRPPYGYHYSQDKKGQLEVDPVHSETVQLIFHLYTQEGYSLEGLARYLSERKVPTYADLWPKVNLNKKAAFGQWNYSCVRHILTNQTYCGKWHWGKHNVQALAGGGIKTTKRDRAEWIAVDVPSVVSEDVWLAAQKQLKENSAAPQNVKHEYLLARRLTCQCGLSMLSKLQKVGKEARHRIKYYKCASTQTHIQNGCNMPYFQAVELDIVIWAWVIRLITDVEFLQELLTESAVKQIEEQAGVIGRLNEVRADLQKHEEHLDKLTRSFIFTNTIDEQTFTKIKAEIEAEKLGLKLKEAEIIGQLNQGTAVRSQAHSVENIIKQFRQVHQLGFFEEAPFDVQKTWIEALDLKATLEVTEMGERFAHLRCVVGEDFIPVDVTLSKQQNLVWYIFYTLELPPLAWARRRFTSV